jgi:perosamine synthetase
MAQRIHLFSPSYGEEEVRAVESVIKSDWWTLGPVTGEFERGFAKLLGTPHAVALNSCTAALSLSLSLLGVGEGDEVIVPTMTFVSTAHAVCYSRANLVFCDVDPTSLLISFDDVKSRLTPRTRAIIPVHYGGRCVDIAGLRDIVGPSVDVIEDCAHACGSSLGGHMAGTLGDIGCFSFHAVKNLATGDGGMLVTRERRLALRAKRLRWLGIDRGTWDRTAADRSYWWDYQVDEVGFKCHMNDLSAAIGLVQLGRLMSGNRRRAEIAALYCQLLGDVPEIVLPCIPDPAAEVSSWHLFPIRAERRDDLSMHLEVAQITTGVHYRPAHLYRCYGSRVSLPVAEREWKRLLSLPMHPRLSDGDVERVSTEIRRFYGR